MAMRRPRIKATALLTAKRKSRDVKSEQGSKLTNDCLEVKNDEPANPPMENMDSTSTDPVVANIEINGSAGKETRVQNGLNLASADEVDKQKSLERNSECVSNNKSVKTSDVEGASTDKKIKTDEINAISNGKENKLLEKVDTSFKCPARIEYARSNSQTTPNIGAEEVFHTYMEESILQLDMQKAVPDKALPLKQPARQRIRPVPLFQRRNSFVSSASPVQGSLEETADMPSHDPTSTSEGDATEVTNLSKINPQTHRRDQHHSAAMVQSPLTTNSAMGQHPHTPHKFTPAMGLSRIRTESNCSAFSDSYVTSSKLRKNDEHTNRSNSRRDFSWRIVNGNLDKSSLKMFDLIYYNPVTNPMEKRTTMSTIKKESTIDENDAKHVTVDSKTELTEGTNNVMPVPQLKLNANGDLILDEKTLEIETTAEQEARKVLANSSLIFLDENTGMNGFYKRQKRTKEWPAEETIKFYRCLQTVGTDFSLMCQLFPKRTRRDLKLKFKKEERSNLALINKALLYPKLFNIDDLKKQLETEEREREEELQRWKEIHAKEAKAIKKVKINASTAARALKNGDDVYENENIVKHKLGRRSNGSEKKRIDSAKKTKTTLTQNAVVVLDDETAEQQNKQNLPRKAAVIPNNNVATNVTQSTAQQQQSHQSESPTATAPIVQEESMSVKLEEEVPAINYPFKAEQCSSQDSNYSHKPNENAVECSEVESRPDQIEEEFINFINPTSTDGTIDTSNEITKPNNNENDINNAAAANLETKTIVDLDDGTVNMLEEADEDVTLLDVMPATPLSVSHRDIDECDIQQILVDLADGSLVLVSTLDPDNADQVINEIYMMDKITGELCDKPLDIPESIVQGVLSVMS